MRDINVSPSMIIFQLLEISDIYFKDGKCVKNRYECEYTSFKESIEKASSIVYDINGIYIISCKDHFKPMFQSTIERLTKYFKNIEEKIVFKEFV